MSRRSTQRHGDDHQDDAVPQPADRQRAVDHLPKPTATLANDTSGSGTTMGAGQSLSWYRSPLDRITR
jgi:hypothetical protein